MYLKTANKYQKINEQILAKMYMLLLVHNQVLVTNPKST